MSQADDIFESELAQIFTDDDSAHPSLHGPQSGLETESELDGLSEGTEPMFAARPTAAEKEAPDDPFMAYQVESTLNGFAEFAGFVAAAVVDTRTGRALGTLREDNGFDITQAAAVNNEVVKAKLRALQSLGLSDAIEDILVTLDTQYHLMRPLRRRPDFFFYLALDRKRANLAMARIVMTEIEGSLE